jgi:DNA-binding Lrp family transcriptional regulator
MSVKAYVFVDCATRNPHHVADALRMLPGVQSADAVAGRCDVIALLQTESMEGLATLLTHHIQRLPGISGTSTNVVVTPWSTRVHEARPETVSTLHARGHSFSRTQHSEDSEERIASGLAGRGQMVRRRRKQ